MYTTIFPYRTVNDAPPNPVIQPIAPVVENLHERNRERTDTESMHNSRNFTDRKINRFIRNMIDIRARLTDEIIEEKSEAVIDSLKEETIELERRFNNILDYCDDDQDVKMINIQFGGKNCNTSSVLG